MNLPPKLAEFQVTHREGHSEKKVTSSLNQNALHFICILFLRVSVKIRVNTRLTFILLLSYLGVSRLILQSLLNHIIVYVVNVFSNIFLSFFLVGF